MKKSLPAHEGPSSLRGRPSYRMLVTDIDGTLLNSESQLAPPVVTAIERARRAGVIVTIATGRRFATCEKLLRDLGLFGPLGPTPIRAVSAQLALQSPPIVLETGAMVSSADGSHVLYRDPLAPASGRQALRILVEAGLQPIAYEDRVIGQRLFTGTEEYDSPAATEFLSRNPELVIRMPYAALESDIEPVHIVVVDNYARVEPILARLELADCRTLISYSPNLDSCFLEVFHGDCSKGTAVAWLAGYLGMGIEDVVCIGDNWNDVEMLSTAGCGIVVANAEPGVKPYARRITVSNDQNAVAVVLNQIVDGTEPGKANPDYLPVVEESVGLAE